MIDRTHDLTIKHLAELLCISRGTFCYPPESINHSADQSSMWVGSGRLRVDVHPTALKVPPR